MRISRITFSSKIVLFACIPAIGLFLLAETTSRVWYYLRTGEGRFLSWGFTGKTVKKGYILPPNTVVVGVDAPGGVRTNRLGLRGRNFDPRPAPNTTRILAMGGSSTWGISNRDGETWPEFLEMKLRRFYPARKFEVVNGGIPAQGVSIARKLLAGKLKDYRFHIGILYIGWNDLSGVFHQPVCEWKKIPNSVHVLNAFSNRLLSFLILREKLSIWAGRGVGGTYDRNRKIEFCSPDNREAVRKKALKNKETFRKFISNGLEDYASELKRLIQEGRSRGMKFLYVRQAHLPRAEGQHANYMSVIWDSTDSVIKPLKVPSFDMHAYAKNYGTPKRVFHNYPNDGIHLTAAGNALLADGLMTTIRDLEWISSR